MHNDKNLSITKKIFFWSFAGLITIGTSIVAVESLLRFVYSPPYKFSLCPGHVSNDPDFGSHNSPNYDCSDYSPILSNTPDVVIRKTTNSLGLRDKEPAVPKPADIFRALFLGDSYVAAWSVTPEETLPNQFKQIHDKAPVLKSKKLDVVNAGVSGFCAYQETEWFIKIG